MDNRWEAGAPVVDGSAIAVRLANASVDEAVDERGAYVDSAEAIHWRRG